MKNLIYFSLLLTALQCTKEESAPSLDVNKKIPINVEIDSTAAKIEVANENKLTKQDSLKLLNQQIIQNLHRGDTRQLAKYIHPEKGVVFSMHGYIRLQKDKHFNQDEIQKYAMSDIKFTWGEKDGSGEKMILSLKDYIKQWVFQRDFSKSNLYINEFKGSGNTINNLKKTFPGADFTENYVAGSEKYSGLDWNSLRLVFEKFEGKYYLVAVINDSWTI